MKVAEVGSMSEAMHDIVVQEIPNLLKKLIDSSQSQANSENAMPSGSHSHVVNDPLRAKTRGRGREKRLESSIKKMKKSSKLKRREPAFPKRIQSSDMCSPCTGYWVCPRCSMDNISAHRPTNVVHTSDAADASPTGDASDATDASPAGDAPDATVASPTGDASDAIDVAPTAMATGVAFHSGGMRGVHSC
ncbi:hypothetical protein Taro_047261 [Colocasia esculenta]|uniref:Uncharacterized protein n=1 Tax=Colocasia esculenta TaxID=4460 RepID=A0A843WVQ9_COLES|nr:hypothetical protein [Colocasia esculenta]